MVVLYLKSECDLNIETPALSADYDRCQCLYTHSDKMSAFLTSHLHKVEQFSTSWRSHSSLLSIPQSPVRAYLSAPIDNKLQRPAHLGSLHANGHVRRRAECQLFILILPTAELKKPLHWNNSEGRLLTNHKQFYCACDAYVLVCLWMTCLDAAWGSPFCEQTLRRGLCSVCVGGRMFIELVISLNE